MVIISIKLASSPQWTCSFSCWTKMCFSGKNTEVGVRKTYIQNAAIHWAKRVTSTFIQNTASKETIGENILYNSHITMQRYVLAYGFPLCPWGYHSHRRKGQGGLWHPVSAAPTHIKASVHMYFPILLVLVRHTCVGSRSTFPALCSLWTQIHI